MKSIKHKDPINGAVMNIRSIVRPEKTWLNGKKTNGYANGINTVLNSRPKRQGKNGWKG